MLPLAWEALASASTSSRILCRKVRSLALLCRLSKPRIRATPKGRMFMLKESNPRSGKPPRNHGSKQSCRPNSKSDQSMIPQYLRFLFIRISLAVLAGSLAPGIIGSSSPQFTSSHFSLGTESKAVSLLRSAQVFAFSSASTAGIEVLHNSTKDAGSIHNGRHSNTKMYIALHIYINTRV